MAAFVSRSFLKTVFGNILTWLFVNNYMKQSPCFLHQSNFWPIIDPEGSLPCSQEPTTGPYPDVSGVVGYPLFYSITFLLLLYHGCSSSFYFLTSRILQWKARSESLVQR